MFDGKIDDDYKNKKKRKTLESKNRWRRKMRFRKQLYW